MAKTGWLFLVVCTAFLLYTQAGRAHFFLGEASPSCVMFLQNIYSSSTRETWILAAQYVVLHLLLVGLMMICLRRFFRQVLYSTKSTILLLLSLAATASLLFLEDHGLGAWLATHSPWINLAMCLPAQALLLQILFGGQIALVSTAFLFVCAATFSSIPLLNLEKYLIIALFLLLFSGNFYKKSTIFVVSAKTCLCVLPWLGLLYWLHGASFSHLSNQLWVELLFFIALPILVSLFIVLLEYLFYFLTPMKLIDYLSPNHPLLHRLAQEAPGTYQHSMMVSHWSQAAAKEIGANDLFCRVAALYHDIGKLFSPYYFAENQVNGFNVHQLLTPPESAQVIIAHVREGLALAKRHRLPQLIIDAIAEHHGDTLVYMPYRTQLELMNGDRSKVNEGLFRYPGPKPRSKETAILMLTDSVEAAVRALELPSDEEIEKLVLQIIDQKVSAGQLEESPLSFQDLRTIKRVLIYQARVARYGRKVKYASLPSPPPHQKKCGKATP